MDLVGYLTWLDYPTQDGALLQNPRNVFTIMNFAFNKYQW